MKTKIILTLILLLLIVPACINVQVDEQDEIPQEPEAEAEAEETEEAEAIVIIPEEAEEETLPENQYNLIFGEILTVDGMNLQIIDMTSSTRLTFSVDGSEKEMQNTKTKEIFNEYYFKMIEYNYNGESEESNVILEIKPVSLTSNQYILDKNEKITLLGKEITLVESRSDNYIKVTVCDEGTLLCDSYVNIQDGEEEEIREITIGNIEQFYTINQYAIISIA
jgi:hypothetical protein